jgi:hypothetical protein
MVYRYLRVRRLDLGSYQSVSRLESKPPYVQLVCIRGFIDFLEALMTLLQTGRNPSGTRMSISNFEILESGTICRENLSNNMFGLDDP